MFDNLFYKLINIKRDDYAEKGTGKLPQFDSKIEKFLIKVDKFLSELKAANLAYSLNSGYRSVEKQIEVKRQELGRDLADFEKKEVAQSMHCLGLAFDIGIKNKSGIVDASLIAKNMFNRIGLYDWGIHIDDGIQKLYWIKKDRYIYFNDLEKALKEFLKWINV